MIRHRTTPSKVWILIVLVFCSWQCASLPQQSHSYANGPTPSVMRVEEDWELIVANPDANSTAPQVTTTLSPTGSSQTLLGAFDLNHRSRPDFQPGGLQVQIWNGDYPVTSQASACECVMSSNGDTVRVDSSHGLG